MRQLTKISAIQERVGKTMIMESKAIITVLIVLATIGLSSAPASALEDKVRPVADEIRYEATLPNSSEIGSPLPLAAHWNSSEYGNGFGPDYQLGMIESGHYLLPWFQLSSPNQIKVNYSYYEKALRKAAALKLPISFLSTQWESILTSSPYYRFLPPGKNPNVVGQNGRIQSKVSPFGPVNQWEDVGKKWTSNALVEKLQAWYPDPPLVLFISNNEHARLDWHEVEQDAGYISLYGTGKGDDFKRKVVGDGWIKLYRGLQKGMREGLIAPLWKNRSVFIGYNAFGCSAFGRWAGWTDYSLYTPGRYEPWPSAWDGASPPYYVNNWNPSTDNIVWSPQIESMNWVFMLNEAKKLNPDFRFEISTWDGYEPAADNDKRKYYSSLGQNYNPERYEGFVQFGMWLLKPRVVREFRNHLAQLSDSEPYFLSIVRSVDRVHNDPVLRRFWRRGRLVANNKYQHPYQSNVTDEYKGVDRWFLLETDLDPKRPWELKTNIPVFAIALVIGEKPNREWLVYAHSPLKAYSAVKFVIPDYIAFAANVAPKGSFYHVVEKKTVTQI
jgi:hypothetical protein